jgi:hypothetical protein
MFDARCSSASQCQQAALVRLRRPAEESYPRDRATLPNAGLHDGEMSRGVTRVAHSHILNSRKNSRGSLPRPAGKNTCRRLTNFVVCAIAGAGWLTFALHKAHLRQTFVDARMPRAILHRNTIHWVSRLSPSYELLRCFEHHLARLSAPASGRHQSALQTSPRPFGLLSYSRTVKNNRTSRRSRATSSDRNAS